MEELRARFPVHTYQLQLECAGNGRSEFHPPARGNQWTTGLAVITGITQATAGGGAVNTISLSGSDNRVNGEGTLQLITPIRVLTNVAGNLGGFGIITLDFGPVPEPGTALLIGAGFTSLGLGLRRRRRKRGVPDSR